MNYSQPEKLTILIEELEKSPYISNVTVVPMGINFIKEVTLFRLIIRIKGTGLYFYYLLDLEDLKKASYVLVHDITSKMKSDLGVWT